MIYIYIHIYTPINIPINILYILSTDRGYSWSPVQAQLESVDEERPELSRVFRSLQHFLAIPREEKTGGFMGLMEM